MLITVLVNAVTTQNASGAMTNPTRTAFSSTTSAYAIEASVLSASGQTSAQSTYRIWFQSCSTAGVSAANFPQISGSAKCLEISPKPTNNGTTICMTDAIAAMGLDLYCWVEMPSITAANGTLTVSLIEMN